jgi:hypothetical protein
MSYRCVCGPHYCSSSGWVMVEASKGDTHAGLSAGCLSWHFPIPLQAELACANLHLKKLTEVCSGLVSKWLQVHCTACQGSGPSRSWATLRLQVTAGSQPSSAPSESRAPSMAAWSPAFHKRLECIAHIRLLTLHPLVASLMCVDGRVCLRPAGHCGQPAQPQR